MADHPRLVILRELTTILEGITPENDYEHDLDGRVFRGRSVFGEDDPVPFLSIIEAPKPDASAIFGADGLARHEQWQLLLQGFARDDVENPTDPLYALLGEVEARLAEMILGNENGPNYMLADDDGQPRITGFEMLPPVVRPPSTTPAAKACFLLPLRVGLALGVG